MDQNKLRFAFVVRLTKFPFNFKKAPLAYLKISMNILTKCLCIWHLFMQSYDLYENLITKKV